MAGLAVGLAAATALVPLEGMPHVTDEVAYTLQARLFAAGGRTGPAAAVPSMWLYPFWVADPVSYSPFPPGWPALLAVGELAGVAWLVNPLLVGLLPIICWGLAREWSSPAVARVAAVLAATSPGVLVLAGSRMSHTSVLVALGVLALVVVRGRDGPRWWALAGMAAGYVVTARPFDAALIAGPLLALGLARAPSWTVRLALLVGPLLGTAAVFADNLALTGSVWTFPMNQWFDGWVDDPTRAGCNRLGFGPDVGCSPTAGDFGHSPGKALSHGWASLGRLDRLYLGVPGGLILAVVGAIRLKRWEPLALTLVVVGGYGLYWSPGLAYGARFWHPLYLVLPVVGAAAAHWILRRWAGWLLGAVGVAALSGLGQPLGDRYWCVDGGLAETLADAGVHDGVVFLRAQGRRETSWPDLGVEAFACDPMLEAGDGFWLNDPAHPGRGLTVRHALTDPSQTQLYLDRHHPGRPAWLVIHDVASDVRTVRRIRP